MTTVRAGGRASRRYGGHVPRKTDSASLPEQAAPATRSTRQRRALVAELSASDGFRSAQDLHHALRQQGESVGLATIYRALQAMVDSGELDTVKADGNEAVYRLCSQAHHHHLVCRQCGRTVEVSGPAVERWASKVAEEHGFTEVDHTLELFGVCQACQSAG